MKQAAIIAFLTLWYLLPVGAQNELSGWTTIGSEDGLSDRTVKSIIRDQHGYIWIATRNGLNRYDGLGVISYTNDPRSQTRINHKDIKSMASRSSGEIFVQYEANRGFIDVLTPETTVAQRLFFNEENGVSGTVEFVELNDRNGDLHLLVSYDSVLAVVGLNEDLHFTHAVTFQDFPRRASSTYRLLTGQRGTFWLNDDKIGLINFDSAGQWLSTISYDTLGLDVTAGAVQIFHQDKLGRFWLTFENAPGIWEFNEAAALFKPVGLENSSENRFHPQLWEDALGNVIIAQKKLRQGGLQKLYLIKPDDAAISYSEILKRETSINEIYSEDFERLLFLGTNSGVKKVNLTKKHVQTYVASEDPDDWSISLRGITSTPDGKIIFAREMDDWYQFDPVEEIVSSIRIDLPYANETKFCPCAKELLTDHQGFIWGCRYSDVYGGQLLKYNVSDSTFESFSFPDMIQSMLIGQDSQIWIVSGSDDTESRLTTFNRYNKSYHHYFNADDSNPLRGILPTFLYQTRNGKMWVGSTTGLLTIDIKNGRHEHFEYSPDDYYGLNSNLIHCITEDKEGNIWIGTDEGVNIYDIQDQSFSSYDVHDGLAGNNVCGIIEDGKGNFWLSTYAGLSYLDRRLKSFRNFGIADGFSHEKFNRFSNFKDTSGTMYFGGVNGLNVFNPNDLLERDLHAPILLSELSYYDKEEGAIVQHLHNLQNLEDVRLAASNRYFRCRFAMADYAYPELNRFMYQLEGRDIGWNYIGSQNELTFNNLAAGNYVLRIVGTDRNLNESSEKFELSIRVEEFFYRKSWFIALCILVVLLAIYLFHRLKLQQAVYMERLRTKISSDLHDDVGGVLSGLAMQTELLEYSAKPEDKPKLKRISEMSRNAMAQMRDVIWATDARKDKFEDLLIRMKEFAAEMLFPKRIHCSFETTNIYKEKKIPVQVRQNLYLIFKEAITNVAKHSDASKVSVNFIKEGSRFTMSIRDDGKKSFINGAPSSLNGSGLKNMQMRAKNIHADLQIEKEKGFKIALVMKTFL